MRYERQTDIQERNSSLKVLAKPNRLEDQAELDLDYANFLEQQGYTREQIGNMTGILSGMPIAATGTSQEQALHLHNNPARSNKRLAQV